MMRWLSLVPMLLSVLLMGCSMETTANSTTPIPSSKTIAFAGQMLPITAEAILANGTRIQLEVAQTPEQQAKGLMYRPALPDNRGMLFQFPAAQQVNFWMKNVPVPLDMVFLQNGVIKYIQASAPPCESEPCPTYGPDVPIDTVIELRSGRAAELNLQEGDLIKIEFLDM
ncbi:DUF192 domain-containing protein [Nodularia sphaerocarpa]|uniref:DUF192 domain-containing protein n=1 Tax=Nodularia sphaerocarpa TaxID=137816 RepID=UPI001EFAE07A|nr:DUF192 domain-containing protein [Nodularia sphaerocarpa]MDB9373160.1 DUF192 domain-containing protein [Nodularia sphaerocarpa CS-585]MDB9379745.1 DUF192 domain-containing protein [Nodularia sphaerocarpa CS-585A2]ULP70679.1 hypothetical protein BDGGKGIB_00296 [Nodularia sphaerocarpa UHCC 0038]